MWRLVSWNVAGRVQRQQQQSAAVATARPDVVALQEVTRTTADLWRMALQAAGLTHVIFSFDLAPTEFVAAGPRRLGLMLASRWPMEPRSPKHFSVPWPERILSAQVAAPADPIIVHATHVPPGASNGWIKIEHLEGLRAGLASGVSARTLLCGDFNTPRRELSDGTVITFGQREDGTATRTRGPRWDAGERNIVTGLGDLGLPDVFRSLYSYEPQPASWILKQRSKRFPRRFDHVFASSDLGARAFVYRHDWREQRLSDHSGVEVLFHDRDTPSH